MASTAHQVFAIPELLEQILLELPIRSLVSLPLWYLDIPQTDAKRLEPNKQYHHHESQLSPKSFKTSHKALQGIKKEDFDPNNPSHMAIDYKTLFRMDSALRREFISQPPLHKITFWVTKFGEGATFETVEDRLREFFEKARGHPMTMSQHLMVDYVWLDLGKAVPDEADDAVEDLWEELSRLEL
ncbi:hypothetical protein AC579_4049 [Pseudocercospora musae]|uniref:Uncharacterized protein n=1 Tax=Pseudocercospora musae TaxID=113226 RepID=A0A139IE00_9PEZI|nr:hypothetical protein AC579_4049 [Pseudocercospora musae]